MPTGDTLRSSHLRKVPARIVSKRGSRHLWLRLLQCEFRSLGRAVDLRRIVRETLTTRPNSSHNRNGALVFHSGYADNGQKKPYLLTGYIKPNFAICSIIESAGKSNIISDPRLGLDDVTIYV